MIDYHKLKGHVSNSSLNVLDQSVREFKKFLYDDYPETITSYYDFGTAMHMYILEPKRFEKEILVIDYTVPKSKQQQDFCKNYAKIKKKTKNNLKNAFLAVYKPTDKWEEKVKQLSTENKAYIKYLQERAKKLCISTKDYSKIQNIGLAIKSHKMASKLLTDPSIIEDDILVFNELQILWKWQGIKCKSMLDRVVIDKKKRVVYIVDLKSTSNVSDFKTSFEKYHYDRQLAFYGIALTSELEKLANIDYDNLITYKVVGVIIAADKHTHEIRVFKIQEQKINKALTEVSDLLERAKWHIDNNKFDYSKEYYDEDGFETL